MGADAFFPDVVMSDADLYICLSHFHVLKYRTSQPCNFSDVSSQAAQFMDHAEAVDPNGFRHNQGSALSFLSFFFPLPDDLLEVK